MLRRLLFLTAVAGLAGVATSVSAQAPAPAAAPAPPPVVVPGVEVTPLAAPDAFTTPGRATGLPPTLWTGAAAKTAKTVLPLLAAKSLSPAGAALARRILATGAPGPEGAARDPELAAARANALMFQGDPKAAAMVLAHAPGLDRSSDLARAAAETALLTGDEQRACQVGDSLTVGRDETYWLKLRTYCQAIAGQGAQAQLTFDLVQGQVKDPVFARLMGAKLSGAGKPGAPSLRNGLDYALSRSLGLDLSSAKASPAVAAAMTGADVMSLAMDPATAPSDVALLAQTLARGEPVGEATLQALLEVAASADPKVRAHGQAATLLAAALAGPLPAAIRGEIAGFATPEGRAPAGRNMALEIAGQQKLMGETALLALWTCAEAGPAGPAIGDRIRIVRALQAAGLPVDARAIAFEGLATLK